SDPPDLRLGSARQVDAPSCWENIAPGITVLSENTDREAAPSEEPDMTIDPALLQLQERLATLPPPVIIYNKSRSGSRLLARALIEQGIFMGAERNESEDALPLLPVVETAVTTYYPAFGRLWEAPGAGPAGLAALVRDAFERHLAGYRPEA